MIKKNIIFSLLAVIFGIALAFVRTGKSGFEPFPAYYILLSASVIILFALSYITYNKPVKNDGKASDPSSGLPPSKSILMRIFAAVSAVCLVVSAVICFITGQKGVLTFVVTAFLFFSALSFIVRAKYSDSTDKCRAYSLFPVYYSCLSLLLFYRENAKLPSVSSYAPEAFCLVFLVLTSYFSSAPLFGKGNVKLRSAFTLSFLALTVSEICVFFVSPAHLKSVFSAFFLPMICGFALFYTSNLFSKEK